MKCKNCGSEISSNSLFCDNCGQPISRTGTVICDNCGAQNVTGAAFCGECGTPIANPGENDQAKIKTAVGARNNDNSPQIRSGNNTIHNVNSDTSSNRSIDYVTEKIDLSSEYIFCGNCGAKSSANAEFCGECGQPLNAELPYNPNTGFDRARGKTNPEKVKKSKKIPIIIISTISIIVILASAAFIGYTYYNNSGHNSENRISDSSESGLTIGSATTPSPTASVTTSQTPSEAAVVGNTESYVNMPTYFVANCDKSVSLRQLPSPTATVLKEMPLGSPVSYVEAAQNGFAKVIYDGTTGYALQSYLSQEKPDTTVRSGNGNTDNNSNNNNNNNGKSTQNNTVSGNQEKGAISYPTYKTYTDPDYNFSCAYPAHFQLYNESDNFVRYSLKATDGTATLKICATKNNSGLSVKNVSDNFKSSYPGSIDYEASGGNWCAVRTLQGSTYHYGYFSLKNGMIRGFEMHFDENYFSIYDNYVNDIYNSLKFN